MPVKTRASGKNASSGSAGEDDRKGNGGNVEGKTNNISSSGGGGTEKDDKQNGGKRKRSESESSTSDAVGETIGPPTKIANSSSRSAASNGSIAVLNAPSRGPSIKAASLMKPSTLPASTMTPVTRDYSGSTSLTGRQLVNSISKRIDAEVKLLLDDIVPRTIDELSDLLQSVNFDRATLAERLKQDESNQVSASMHGGECDKASNRSMRWAINSGMWIE